MQEAAQHHHSRLGSGESTEDHNVNITSKGPTWFFFPATLLQHLVADCQLGLKNWTDAADLQCGGINIWSFNSAQLEMLSPENDLNSVHQDCSRKADNRTHPTHRSVTNVGRNHQPNTGSKGTPTLGKPQYRSSCFSPRSGSASPWDLLGMAEIFTVRL